MPPIPQLMVLYLLNRSNSCGLSTTLRRLDHTFITLNAKKPFSVKLLTEKNFYNFNGKLCNVGFTNETTATDLGPNQNKRLNIRDIKVNKSPNSGIFQDKYLLSRPLILSRDCNFDVIAFLQCEIDANRSKTPYNANIFC